MGEGGKEGGGRKRRGNWKGGREGREGREEKGK